MARGKPDLFPQKLWISLWVAGGKPEVGSGSRGLAEVVGFLRKSNQPVGRMGSTGRSRCQFHGTAIIVHERCHYFDLNQVCQGLAPGGLWLTEVLPVNKR